MFRDDGTIEYGIPIPGVDPALADLAYPNDANLRSLVISSETVRETVLITLPEHPTLYTELEEIELPVSMVKPFVDGVKVGAKVTAELPKGGRRFKLVKTPPKTERDNEL